MGSVRGDTVISEIEIQTAVAKVTKDGPIYFYTGPLVADDKRLYAALREAAIPQLILIYQAYTRSEYDITPDRWTVPEIELALRGLGHGAESER